MVADQDVLKQIVIRVPKAKLTNALNMVVELDALK
jgi:hypothetical protein